MRLLTFQPEQVLTAVVSGQYKRPWRDTSRIKDIDADLVEDGFEPFYVFATIAGMPMCLRTVARNWSFLMGYMRLSNHSVMLELEVPESEIFNIKGEGCTEKSGIVPASVLHDAVAMEAGRGTYEAVLKEVRPEWLVAYRLYKAVGYEKTKVETVTVNHSLFPLWEDTVYLSGDGYVYSSENAEEGDLVYQHLPNKCYGGLSLYYIREYLSNEGITTIGTMPASTLREVREYAIAHGYPTIRDCVH